MVTIADVAKEAEVSLATVSRVINNSVLVSEDKRKRVLQAVETLGYQPIRITSARQAQQDKVIVVVTSMLHTKMFDAIRETADELGYRVAFTYVGESEGGYRSPLALLDLLPKHLIGGIIVANNFCLDKNLWSKFCEHPVVQIGEYRHTSPLFSILSDDRQGANEIVTHLIEQGNQRIAFVTSEDPARSLFKSEREAGYKTALRENGIEPDPALHISVDYTQDGGAEAAHIIMKMKPRPTAVFCIADMIAVGCLNEFIKAGLNVPKDIAVCGYDNFEISECCQPALTTIAQSFDEMGSEAVRVLDMLISDPTLLGRKIYVSHKLLVRGSTV